MICVVTLSIIFGNFVSWGLYFCYYISNISVERKYDAQFDVAVVVWKCVILFFECILLHLTEKKGAHLCKINLTALNSS